MSPSQTQPPLLLHVFSSFAVGGVQTRFAAIVNHFGLRWRHAIVAMDGDLSCRERLDPGLSVEFPAVDIRKGDTLGNAWRFRRVLRRMRPSMLVTSNWGTIEWSMANLLPVVPHVHVEDGFGPDDPGGQLPRRGRTRRIVLGRKTVIVPSRTLWCIATETWRLDPKRLRYVPNGIDLDRFVPNPSSADATDPVVGTVAALRGEKNIGRLLRAFALATPEGVGRLLIAGDGPERAALGALAESLGVAARVTFAGHVARPAPLFRQMDVFAMSSDTEQMPMSLLEGMAAGLPVVATDVGDIRTMVASVNALAITARDDAALAAALRTFLTDPALRRRVGQANRAKAETEFDQATMFAAWADAFDGRLGPRTPGPTAPT